MQGFTWYIKDFNFKKALTPGFDSGTLNKYAEQGWRYWFLLHWYENKPKRPKQKRTWWYNKWYWLWCDLLNPKCILPQENTQQTPQSTSNLWKRILKEEKCLVPHAPTHEFWQKNVEPCKNKEMTSNLWHSKSWIWLLPLMNSEKKSLNLAKSKKCYVAFDIPNCEFGRSHSWILKKNSWTLQNQRNDIYFFDLFWHSVSWIWPRFWAQYSEVKTKTIAGAHQIHRHRHARANI